MLPARYDDDDDIFNDNKTDGESENIIKFLLLSYIRLDARSMLWALVLNG